MLACCRSLVLCRCADFSVRLTQKMPDKTGNSPCLVRGIVELFDEVNQIRQGTS